MPKPSATATRTCVFLFPKSPHRLVVDGETRSIATQRVVDEVVAPALEALRSSAPELPPLELRTPSLRGAKGEVAEATLVVADVTSPSKAIEDALASLGHEGPPVVLLLAAGAEVPELARARGSSPIEYDVDRPGALEDTIRALAHAAREALEGSPAAPAPQADEEPRELLPRIKAAKARGAWSEVLELLDGDLDEAWMFRERGIAKNKHHGKDDPEAGIDDLERAVELDPSDWDAWSSLGGALLRAGHPERALKAYDEAARRSDGHPYPVLAGLKLRAQLTGELRLDDEALELLARAESRRLAQLSSDHPDRPWSHFDLAEIALYRGEPDVALRLLEEGLAACEADWMPATFARGLRLIPDDARPNGLDELLERAEQRAVELGATRSSSGEVQIESLPAEAPEIAQVLLSSARPRYRTSSTPEEACLHAHQYADALAEFFRGADDELCFGLLGHWGRGKTYLMGLVSDRLRADGWATVDFSAWKFPSTPDLWVHLYETVRARAVDGSTARSLGLALRTSLVRHGTTRLVGSLTVLLLLAAPLWPAVPTSLAVLSSAAGLLAALHLIEAVTSHGTALRQRFIQVTRHDGHLGLQAVLGSDLEALVRAWVPVLASGERDRKVAEALHPSRGAVLVTVATVVGAVLAWAVVGSFQAGGADSPIDWTDREQALTLGLGAALTWLAAYWLWVEAAHGGPHPARVLLVVDDLDRCAPSAMLEVAEQLKLFLELDDVKERLFVAMLVDEVAFGRAILTKYDALREPDPEQRFSPAFDGLRDRDVLQENLEKIFVAYLRLGPISENDLEEVAQSFLGVEADSIERVAQDDEEDDVARVEFDSSGPSSEPTDFGEDGDEPLENGPAPDGSDVGAGASARRTDAATGSTPVDGAPRPTPPADVGAAERAATGTERSGPPFTASEVAALRRAARDLGQESDRHRSGPRSVRCFLARYQLAREILRALGQEPEPEALARAVDGLRSLGTVQDPVLVAIARQTGAVYGDLSRPAPASGPSLKR